MDEKLPFVFEYERDERANVRASANPLRCENSVTDTLSLVRMKSTNWAARSLAGSMYWNEAIEPVVSIG